MAYCEAAQRDCPILENLLEKAENTSEYEAMKSDYEVDCDHARSMPLKRLAIARGTLDCELQWIYANDKSEEVAMNKELDSAEGYVS